MNQKRVLIIGADGMRPDSFDAKLMPTYAKLLTQGCFFPNFMAAYPSHTRVNAATLTSGVNPGTHGLVSNVMYTPTASKRLLDTSKAQDLLQFQKDSGEAILLAPSLGDRLAAQGKRLAVASAGSTGSAFLWNPMHPERIINPNWHYDQAELMALHEKLGDVPQEEKRSKKEACKWVTEAMIDTLLEDDNNQVISLWLAEPDSSQHFYGLGSPEAKASLKCVDDCVALVLDALECRNLIEDFELLLISDHGHATVKEGISLSDVLKQASTELELSGSFVGVLDFVYAEAGTKIETAELQKLADWLAEQSWCDTVYAAENLNLQRTKALENLVGPIRHQRYPLLAINPNSHDDVNEFGVEGITESLSPYSMLKSSHGSASRYEMNAFCLMVGERFPANKKDIRACGTLDIAATIADILQLSQEGLEGQSLIKEQR